MQREHATRRHRGSVAVVARNDALRIGSRSAESTEEGSGRAGERVWRGGGARRPLCGTQMAWWWPGSSSVAATLRFLIIP